jgi:hypothetical protein
MSNQMTPVGVPSELVFDLPASMLDSRKIEERIQPYSQSTFNTAGQVAKFTIPQTDRKALSGQTMYLTGNLDIGNLFKADGTTPAVAGTDTFGILGSFYSLFSRQVINANGSVLETIERPGELCNTLINMTMNSAEKTAQGNSLGTAQQASINGYIPDGSGNISYQINDTLAPNNSKTITFAIPIIGVLDSLKYLPMWNSNIDLELTINALPNWLTGVNGSTSVNNTTFSLYNLELVFDSIELSPESFSMVMANYPQKVVVKTQSYLAGTGALANGVSGGQDIPINARLSSMKQLFFYFNQTTCADQTFGGVNPNANDVVFITNGKYYPQRPIKLTNPSEVYMQIQKSFGSIKSYSHSGAIGIYELRRRNVANNYYLVAMTSKTALDNYGNKFYLAIDTEIINTNKASLYNGIQTGVNSNIRLNIADALGSAMTCYYWCCYDVLLEFDFMTGTTRAIY